MTRLDDLTLKQLAGTISEAEVTELQKMVEEDASAYERYLRLIQVEATLRAGRPPDMTGRVIAGIRSQRTERVAKGVLKTVRAMKPPVAELPRPGSSAPGRAMGRSAQLPPKSRTAAMALPSRGAVPFPGRGGANPPSGAPRTGSLPSPGPGRPPSAGPMRPGSTPPTRPRSSILALAGGVQQIAPDRETLARGRGGPSWVAGLGFGLGIGVLIAAAIWFTSKPAEPPAPDHVVATIMETAAPITVMRKDKPIALGRDQLLRAGDILRSGSSQLSFRYLDGSVVKLMPATVTLADGQGPEGEGSAKLLEIDSGEVDINSAAQPPGQPLLVETRQARLTVSVPTRFKIRAGTGGTRVSVDTGALNGVRTSDGSALEVSAKEDAVFAPGTMLVPIPAGHEPPGESGDLMTTFSSDREVSMAWELIPDSFIGRVNIGALEIDLSATEAARFGTTGWAEPEGGIWSRRPFSLPVRVTVDWEATVKSEWVRSAIAFRPSGGDAIYVVRRFVDGQAVVTLMQPLGNFVKEQKIQGRWPHEEQLVAILRPGEIEVTLDARPVFRHTLKTPVTGGACRIGILANATRRAAATSRVRFDEVRVEENVK